MFVENGQDVALQGSLFGNVHCPTALFGVVSSNDLFGVEENSRGFAEVQLFHKTGPNSLLFSDGGTESDVDHTNADISGCLPSFGLRKVFQDAVLGTVWT